MVSLIIVIIIRLKVLLKLSFILLNSWKHSEPDKLYDTLCAFTDMGGTATKLTGKSLFNVFLTCLTADQWCVFYCVLQTIGELFLILSEMGFTEEQIQAAMQAGHFSVPDAAEWWVDSALFLNLVNNNSVMFVQFLNDDSKCRVPLSYVDRLLQGQYPRHRLVKQSSQPAETAFSAFNPPKEAASTSESQTCPPENRGITRQGFDYILSIICLL